VVPARYSRQGILFSVPRNLTNAPHAQSEKFLCFDAQSRDYIAELDHAAFNK
jgi:hypothetical protein